jgi:hypothetical protein
MLDIEGIEVISDEMRAMTRLWEPWVYSPYGAGFDRQTEKHVPKA